MAIDPNLSSLLRSLKVDEPLTPPRTWESIPSESGGEATRSGDSSRKSPDGIYESSSISEAALVRLVINALLGVKSSLMEIDKLSAAFLLDPADRTYHRVPTPWCRALSTNVLGKILRDISYSGYLVFFLQEFIKFYLCGTRDSEGGTANKVEANANQDARKITDDLLRGVNGKDYVKDALWMHPPYSLVNQSFAVAVKKVLQGYFGALNTLLSSVKLRRSVKNFGKSIHTSNGMESPLKIVDSGITILETFLHTKELRTNIEVLGNICFPRFVDLALSTENLTADSILEFHNFPRGADLLSYLYVQLRDADPVHQALLKFLFMYSCKPYCGFIKSWIYRAEVDDPYEEFFVCNSAKFSNTTESSSNFQFKERDDAIVPCFLKDVCRPLLRAGQQLEVLVKLLSLSSFTYMGGRCDVSCNWANLEDILPCWVDMAIGSTFILDSLTFCNKRIETLMHQRQKMYQAMLGRLQVFLSNFDAKSLGKNHDVSPFGNAPDLLGGRVHNIPFLEDSSENLLFCSINDEEKATKINSSERHTDSSFTSEFSYDEEAWQSSECSSSYSSEDEIEPEKVSTLHDKEPQSLLSNISTSFASKRLMPNYIETGKHCSQNPRDASFEELGSMRPLSDQKYEDESLDKNSVPAFFGDVRPTTVSMPGDECTHPPYCWPAEGLLRNPFSSISYEDLIQYPFNENKALNADRETGALTCAESVSTEVIAPFKFKLDMTKNFDFMGAEIGHPSLNTSQSYTCNKSYNLSANPVMTKASWFSEMENLKNISSIKDHRTKFPYFDFSSVSNPSLSYSGNIFPCPDNEPVFGASRLHNTEVSSTGVNKILPDTHRDQTRNECVFPADDMKIMHKDFSSSISGGAAWVGSLEVFGRHTKSTAGNMLQESASEFDIPLDVVIDKCILQEIITQYKYVSNFTIKLLEEGFDLHEHLFALRRYHFMELGDWADLFISYLRNQKWSNILPDKKIPEIQGLLELALKKSSCDTDQYKERLFVYLKEQNNEPAVTCATDIELFDAILLGYRVDWPISIVVTQGALKIYAVIFGYLTQVRLASFALKDAWHFMKALLHRHTHSPDARFQKMEFKNLMELRQQMHHFVSALQQYVHSQLSDVSWCRFQHSLKYQVKDMLDLEYVHMSFLKEALHICFLSDETKLVAPIIKNILQCAFDFGKCLTGVDLYVKMDEADASNLQSYINFDEVLTIKSAFERNIQELYLLYLRSSKHGQSGLFHFWAHLNYNEYYSTVLNKNMGYRYL